jgi:hypothetical protein
MDLLNKNSITFVGEKSYVNNLNLQILTFLTGMKGFRVSLAEYKEMNENVNESNIVIFGQ